MYIFEIIKPGTWLTLSDDNSINFNLQKYIDFLISHFYEANISLNLFIKKKEEFIIKEENTLSEKQTSSTVLEPEASIRNRVREKVELKYKEKGLIENFEQYRNEIELEVEREKCRQTGIEDYKSDTLIRLEISEVIKSKYINYTAQDKSEKMNNDIEIEIKRYKWNQGEIPQTFRHNEIYIYAKSFIFSIDNFVKEVKMLSEDPNLKNKITPLKIELTKIFPDLIEIRNTTHHFEDRIRGKRFKNNIDLKPIDNGVIYAPNGGTLILNMLNDNKYGCTLGDGTFGEVEISPSTMKKLQLALQDFLNSLKWKGHIEILPN